MTLPLTPELAPWVVPSSLGVLAVLLSPLALANREIGALPPQADDPDVRVLRRQVDVLTRTLAEWDAEQRAARPSEGLTDGRSDPPAVQHTEQPSAADPSTPPPGSGGTVPPVSPVPPHVGPSTAYAALSRELAAAGDATGAVLAQWAADLQVLRPALGAHGADLARAVSDVRLEEPVAALRACREAALGLVRTAGSVRALLAPLDHLGDLSDLSGVAHPAGEDEAVVPSALPQPLLDLPPPAWLLQGWPRPGWPGDRAMTAALPWPFVVGLVAPLGLAIGSFLNVVVHRVPQGLSVVHPPSACPQCRQPVRGRDNVPVLSWLLPCATPSSRPAPPRCSSPWPCTCRTPPSRWPCCPWPPQASRWR